MRRYTIVLTEHALSDLEDIAHYITSNDGPEKANTSDADREGFLLAGDFTAPRKPSERTPGSWGPHIP